MAILKSFHVLGELVEVLVDGKVSGGSVAVVTQTSPPGGGPPPHSHTHEDETFTVLEGEFEIFNGASWQKLTRGEAHFGPRGGVHAFRNCGNVDGKMLIFISPAGMEDYLEQISTLSLPGDLEALQRISDRFGIHFA